MDDKDMSRAEFVGALVTFALFGVLVIAVIGGWSSVSSVLVSGEGSGWAQAVGTVGAIMFTWWITTNSQRHQDRQNLRAAERSYDDLLLMATTLLWQCSQTADKIRKWPTAPPFPSDLLDFAVEMTVMSSALQRVDFGRLRGPELTGPYLVGVAAAGLLVGALTQEERASAQRDANWELVRKQSEKAVIHLGVAIQAIWGAFLARHPDLPPGQSPFTYAKLD